MHFEAAKLPGCRNVAFIVIDHDHDEKLKKYARVALTLFRFASVFHAIRQRETGSLDQRVFPLRDVLKILPRSVSRAHPPTGSRKTLSSPPRRNIRCFIGALRSRFPMPLKLYVLPDGTSQRVMCSSVPFRTALYFLGLAPRNDYLKLCQNEKHTGRRYGRSFYERGEHRPLNPFISFSTIFLPKTVRQETRKAYYASGKSE